MNPTRDQILGFLTEVNTEFAGTGPKHLEQLREENFVNPSSLVVNQQYLLAWKQTVDAAVSQIAAKWFGEEISLEEDLKKWYCVSRAQLYKDDEQFVFVLKEINSKSQAWRMTIKTALLKDQSIFTMPEEEHAKPADVAPS